MIFSLNNQLLYSNYWDNTIKVWRVEDWSLVTSIEGHLGIVECVAVSYCGQYIASGSCDKTIKVWKTSDEYSLYISLSEHQNSVKTIAFSLNKKYLISGSNDKQIIVWDYQHGHVSNIINLVEIEEQIKDEWISNFCFTNNWDYIFTGSA